MSFSPDQIAIRLLLDDADQFFELFLRLFEPRRIGRLCCCLCTPGRVGKTKLNPTQFGSIEFALVDFRIEFVCAGIRPLRVLQPPRRFAVASNRSAARRR